MQIIGSGPLKKIIFIWPKLAWREIVDLSKWFLDQPCQWLYSLAMYYFCNLIRWLSYLTGRDIFSISHNYVGSERGAIIWVKDGQLHREYGPAVLHPVQHREWYQNGKLHREDGPAIVDAVFGKEWYLNGELHRLDGPAIQREYGGCEWWIHGKRHRENGPAVVHQWLSKQWWRDGRTHREDGPAIEDFCGLATYWRISGFSLQHLYCCRIENLNHDWNGFWRLEINGYKYLIFNYARDRRSYYVVIVSGDDGKTVCSASGRVDSYAKAKLFANAEVEKMLHNQLNAIVE